MTREQAQSEAVRSLFKNYLGFSEAFRAYGVETINYRYAYDGNEYELSINFADFKLAIAKLTKLQQVAVFWHLIADRPYSEIAAKYNKSPDTVRESVNASVKILARHFFNNEEATVATGGSYAA